MKKQTIGTSILRLPVVDSTNKYASALIFRQRPEDGTVIIATDQTNGLGHQKTKWESESGKNIALSVILYPEFLECSKHFLLNQAMALGVYDFVKDVTGKNVTVKWPNDILYGDKKIAGLLIENSMRGNVFSSSIVGIGININQQNFSDYTPAAVSIKNILNKEQDMDYCLAKLLIALDYRYEILRSGNYEAIKKDFTEALFRLNEYSLFEIDAVRTKGIIKGIDNEGQLILDIDGSTRLFGVKELKYVFK